jgi:hypothetical protein
VYLGLGFLTDPLANQTYVKVSILILQVLSEKLFSQVCAYLSSSPSGIAQKEPSNNPFPDLLKL